MATIDEIIQMQSDTIRSTLSTARETTSRISGATVPHLSKPALHYAFTKPELQKPPSFGELLPGDTTSQTVKFLNTEAQKWIDTYFPELSACLKDKPEQWLCKILGGEDPFGDSRQVFDTVWHQARDQAFRERRSLEAGVRADFSLRGFTVPPGAMIGAMLELQERASDAVATVNREEMKRVAEIKLDLLKFAEEQAIRLKLGIMQSMADFYRQWISLPQKDVELARAKAQAYSAMQSALSSYYQVELGFEELRLRAATTKTEVDISHDRNRISAAQGDQKNSALANAVRAFGDVAAAAATSQAGMIAEVTGG